VYSHGVWKYWLTPTTSVMSVCGSCATKIADVKEKRVAQAA